MTDRAGIPTAHHLAAQDQFAEALEHTPVIQAEAAAYTSDAQLAAWYGFQFGEEARAILGQHDPRLLPVSECATD